MAAETQAVTVGSAGEAGDGAAFARATRRHGATRLLGHASLTVMGGGFVCMEVLTHLGVVGGVWWGMLTMAFEAGTVGALADWYAVTALFREIRLPVVKLGLPLLTRHSNLILRNRQRITDNIAEMVQHRWLSPEEIGRQLAAHAPAEGLIEYLGEPERLRRVLEQVRWFLHTNAPELEQPEFVEFLETAVRDQLRGVALARPLGQWVRSAIQRGDHHRVWEALLATAEQSLSDPELREWLAEQVVGVMQRYAEENWVKRIAVWMGEMYGVVEYRGLTRRVLDKLLELVREAQERPDGELRRRLDAAVLEFAGRLESGEEQAVTAVQYLWERVIEHAELGPLLRGAMGRFAGTLERETRGGDTPLMRVLAALVERQLSSLREDPERRAALNAWVSRNAAELVGRYRDLIGATVRAKLAELADEQWSGEIEEKVGDDLQWIRVNGAVVGFLVGLIIAVGRGVIGAL